MDKKTLRNSLFAKYFEVENGVLITDLMDKLSFVKETWKNLFKLLEKNEESCPYRNQSNSLTKIKVLEHNKKKYLIIRKYFWRYIIIDLETKESITTEEFKNTFEEEFFVNNFNEESFDNPAIFQRAYRIENYKGDIDELLNFYIENEDILTASNKISYEIKIGEAYTILYIGLIGEEVQLLFGTPDQFLYDQLFMNYDLSPRPLQDAQEKIGHERMLEMFEQVKDIKIPKEAIPKDLYEIYLSTLNNKNTRKRIKNKLNK